MTSVGVETQIMAEMLIKIYLSSNIIILMNPEQKAEVL